ncbi:hypothetical protein CXB77_12475 [Chromatium okenii]|uniref:Uncharacterized protein n=1 Tax=Chromatium okenii TaxID=61644 RepID=A0A2S7XN85_9GAMM|nr:hypothetical protein CXB77_12475 [Chromatium okenii]
MTLKKELHIPVLPVAKFLYFAKEHGNALTLPTKLLVLTVHPKQPYIMSLRLYSLARFKNILIINYL